MRLDLDARAKAALALACAFGGGTGVAFLAVAGAEAQAWIAGRWRAGIIERQLDEIRAPHFSLLAWDGEAAAWDDADIAIVLGPDGRVFERLLCRPPEIVAEAGPGLDGLPEGWTALPSPWEATSAHARLLWESLLPSQIRRPHALLDGSARLLRRDTLVALCPLSLTIPLGLRRIP